MKQSNVTAIVVNWNLKEETLRCLQSIRQLDYQCNVIVVDNGSRDGSIDLINTCYPDIRLISLSENVGFGTACNIAITEVLNDKDCDYFLLLNNDALIAPDALTELIRTAESHPETGIFGPKIYLKDEKNRIWYAGARRRKFVLAATDTGKGNVDHGQFNQLTKVDYVFGAAMLIRRTVIKKIGLFDERFFLYLEDLDYCLRAQQAGFSLLYVPQAIVYHIGSASTAKQVALRKYHYTRSTTIFLKKHISYWMLIPVLGFWTGVILKMMIYDLINNEGSALQGYWPGLLNGLMIAQTDHKSRLLNN